MSQQKVKDTPKTPFELFRVECRSGWNHLIKPLFEYIEKYNQDKKEEDKIEILQVKEKFGGLRFYTNFYTKELDDLIDKATEESYQTCELCGTKENVGHTEGWITTCCKECVKQMARKRGRPYRWTIDSKTITINHDGEIEEKRNE